MPVVQSGPALAIECTAGAFVPLKTAARVGATIAAATFLGLHLPPFGKLATLLVAPIIGVAYLVALVAMGELGRSDLALVVAIVRPKK